MTTQNISLERERESESNSTIYFSKFSNFIDNNLKLFLIFHTLASLQSIFEDPN